LFKCITKGSSDNLNVLAIVNKH